MKQSLYQEAICYQWITPEVSLYLDAESSLQLRETISSLGAFQEKNWKVLLNPLIFLSEQMSFFWIIDEFTENHLRKSKKRKKPSMRIPGNFKIFNLLFFRNIWFYLFVNSFILHKRLFLCSKHHQKGESNCVRIYLTTSIDDHFWGLNQVFQRKFDRCIINETLFEKII